jgi:two-component system KDP operon response regulator KdpE
MPKQPRILVVDDEAQITRVLRAALSAQGYLVRTAAEGQQAIDLVQDWSPDAVITDLSMPHMDGLELCRRLRQQPTDVPIIVLSVRGEERGKVDALDAGADDYVVKPFGMNELLARIRALLRRVPPDQGDGQALVIEVDDLRIDIEQRHVSIAGRWARLTPKEFELLAYMARRPNRVLTHHTLLEALWGSDYLEHVEYLRVFIGQLRKKIEPNAAKPRFIVTEPWVGYRFVRDVTD